MKTIISIITLVISLPLQSMATLVLPHKSISKKVLSKHLKIYPNTSNFVQWHEKNNNIQALDDRLVQNIFFYRNNTRTKPQLALLTLQKANSLLHQKDWNLSNRKLIFWSLIEIAKHENKQSKRLNKIRKALQFTSEFSLKTFYKTKYSSDFKLDYYKEYSQQSLYQWVPTDNFLKFNYVLINGRKRAIKAFKALPITSKATRFTFISNYYEPYTYIGHITNIPKKIKLKFLITNNCKQGSFPIKDQKIFVLFKNPCENHSISSENKDTASKVTILNLTHLPPLPEKLPNESLMPLKLTTPVIAVNTHQSAKKKKTNKWLWIGASLVTGYLVYLQSQNNEVATSSIVPPTAPKKTMSYDY